MAGTIKIDTIQSELTTPTVFKNSSGTEIGRLCRSFLNYNCSGTTINGSFNISSVTRNGAGDFSLTMSTALIDIYYSTVGSCNRLAAGGDGIVSLYANNGNGALVDPTTTVARINASLYNNNDSDFTYNCVTITR